MVNAKCDNKEIRWRIWNVTNFFIPKTFETFIFRRLLALYFLKRIHN